MSQIQIQTESEEPGRWRYHLQIRSEQGVSDHQVCLSWLDYDLWCHGRIAPQEVVRAMIQFLLEQRAAEAIPNRFDCAVVRRWYAQVDRILPTMFS